jgi:hypothetical protein
MAIGCNGPYAPNASCMITLTFTPLAAGQRSAILSISDDAQNAPQSIQVSGTATAASPTNPAVSLSPSGLSFGVITQGTAIGPQSVTVTNSGGAPLHITSILLGGANGGEFIMTNGCTAASYTVNATCTIGVSFAPLGTGSRSATITLADDAPNSPQVINLGGNASPAVTLGPAPGGSTSATVSTGQTAVYNLQITPGAGYTGSVALAFSAPPLGANIQAPSTLQISNGNPASFTVMVTTSAAGAPLSFVPRPTPLPALRAAPALAAGVLLLFLIALAARRDLGMRARRVTFGGSFATIAALIVMTTAGCGGGSTSVAAPPPPQAITPQGSFNIVVTPSAMSASGQPLQLQPIQLSLTVK